MIKIKINVIDRSIYRIEQKTWRGKKYVLYYDPRDKNVFPELAERLKEGGLLKVWLQNFLN